MMRAKARVCAMTSAAFLACLLVFMPLAAGAGSITLTPTAQAPGASVSVAGTGFGAAKNVSIGFGAEVAVTNEPYEFTGSGLGPYIGTLSNKPVKPGSFVMSIDVNNGLAIYQTTDNGDGTLSSTSPQTASGTINYATGQITTYARSEPGSYTVVHTVRYTRYQYNVTPAAGLTTNASGSFSGSITVPTVANGNYNVTAIDSGGSMATATLNVNSTIPEILPFGAVLLLTSLAVVAGSWYFRKRPKIAVR